MRPDTVKGETAARIDPIRPRIPRWWLAAMLLAVVTAPGLDAQQRPNPVLLKPDDPFWSQRAPDTLRVRVETTRGPFVIEAYRSWAPIGVDRFYNLVRAGFYDDSRFYRVRPRWAQFGIAGDPAVSAVWRDRRMPDDPVVASNLRGTIAYAMTGPNARTTQVYISLIDRADQDRLGFTVFGRVIAGMPVVDSLYAGYGEASGGGMRAGKQAPLFEGGNAYLDANYPLLDKLIRATVERIPRQS